MKRIVIAVVLLAVFAAVTVAFLSLSAGAVKQRNCKQQLRSFGAFLRLYRQDHTNQLPYDLDSLDKTDREMRRFRTMGCQRFMAEGIRLRARLD